MKVRFNHWYNAVLTALLSMLGYSCSSSDGPVEYGTPSANYEVKGCVTDEAGVPVQGIKTFVKLVETYNNKVYVKGMDSILTNESGNYQLKYSGGGFDRRMKLIVKDIDGPANGGQYKSDTLDIDYDKAVKVKNGDGHWFMGDYEITKNIQLKKDQ